MSVPFSNGRPVPVEILENIAYELVVSTPLGNPSQITPLLLTTRAINAALSMQSRTSLYSRICRFKFDIGAVTSRAFTPRIKDLNGHLVQMCNLLKFIRRRDVFHEDVEDQLLIAYTAMLDNDGKNRAQLKDAGIEEFVDNVVRLRLGEGRQTNHMWPVESMMNSCALWLMWMFTTREKLQQETMLQRAEIISLVFPYIVCPYRYACALVPPNHFVLPLGKSNPVQGDLFTSQTAHGSYPLYHINKVQPLSLYYFRSSTSFLEPLITPVAKLLYWCRHELGTVYEIPRELAVNRAALGRPGLTQEDIAEFNDFKVAKFPPDVTWDWEKGSAVVAEDGVVREYKDGDSARWNIDWWRARLCDNLFVKQPKWRLGAVYLRGMLTGLWQGVQFGQSHTALNNFILDPQCPPNLHEVTAFGPRPLLMRLSEHGFVRTPIPNASTNIEDGPIPHAPPSHMPITVTTRSGSEEAIVPVDISLCNAWLPGPVGSLRWMEGGGPLDAGVKRDPFISRQADGSSKTKEAMSTVKFFVSSEMPNAFRNAEFTSQNGGPVEGNMPHNGPAFVYETYDKSKECVHQRMVDAKEQLAVLASSAASCSSPQSSQVKTPPEPHPGCLRCADRAAFLADRKRKDTVRGRRALPSRAEVDDMFSTIGMSKGSNFASYLPAEVLNPLLNDAGMDDDEEMEVVDIDLGADADDDSDDEAAIEESPPTPRPPVEDARRTTEPESISVDAQAGDSLAPSSLFMSSRSSSSSSDGDSNYSGTETEEDPDFDQERGYPGVCDSAGRVAYESVRRSHDRYRVEPCDDGIEDVVLTGGLDDRHRLAWGRNIYYGRVRPWDGLIAILRIVQDRNSLMNANMIYYGYVYGGNMFVGNWRYAGVDPLMPAFESSFIMSKREE